MSRQVPFMVALCWLASCTESPPSQRQYLVGQTRLVAITVTPSEAAPGQPVMLQGFWATPEPALAPLPSRSTWSTCIEPKAPSEDNAVSAPCADSAGPGLLAIVGGQESIAAMTAVSSVAATIPSDACARFGPDTPPGSFRPRAADATGGYYQPFRLERDDADGFLGFALARIKCNLAGAPPALSQQFGQQYVANIAPVAELVVPATVAAGQSVDLSVRWPDNQRESYLWYDPATVSLKLRRESIRVTWFTTAGTMAVDGDAVLETQAASQIASRWQAPIATGTVQVWAIVRDSRGGQSVLSATLAIQ